MSGVYLERLKRLYQQGIINENTVGRVDVMHKIPECSSNRGGPCDCDPEITIESFDAKGRPGLWRVWEDHSGQVRAERVKTN